MKDDDQRNMEICERMARNVIYPGGRLHMSYYEDKEVGNIYIAIGKGDFAADQYGREATLDMKTEDCVLIKDVWRGMWSGKADGQWWRKKINCLAGDWSLERAQQDVIRQAKHDLKILRGAGRG